MHQKERVADAVARLRESLGRLADDALSESLIEQAGRISQAAVLRANAVAERLATGLTGAEVADSAIRPAAPVPGLVASTGAGGEPADAPLAVSTPRRAPGGAVRLSAEQLRVNQRISQAAVRRANAGIALLEAGLGDASFAPGAIDARHLAPEPAPG